MAKQLRQQVEVSAKVKAVISASKNEPGLFEHEDVEMLKQALAQWRHSCELFNSARVFFLQAGSMKKQAFESLKDMLDKETFAGKISEHNLSYAGSLRMESFDFDKLDEEASVTQF